MDRAALGIWLGPFTITTASADLLLDEKLQTVVAVIVVLILLYGVEWATTQVLGRRFIALIESLIEFIPFVDIIYRSTKNSSPLLVRRRKVNAGSFLSNSQRLE